MKLPLATLTCLVVSSIPAFAHDCPRGVPPPADLLKPDPPVSLLVSSTPAPAPHFEGSPDVHWDDEGWCMTMLNDYSYVDSRGLRWTAWKGMETDGASIPPAVWTIIGGPFEGPYRNAALVHDSACYLQNRSWQAAARMFFEAMLTAGTGRIRALTMYEAVNMFGPKWTLQKTVLNLTRVEQTQWMSQLRYTENLSTDTKVDLAETKHPDWLTSGKADYTFAISPPTTGKFTVDDFAHYKEVIEQEEQKSPGSVTLDEIEKFAPQDQTQH